MFRDLIPQLSDKFHVIAPDYVGFGYSDAPSVHEFKYTFDNLAAHIEDLLFKNLGLKHFSIYVQDYGAPVGYRIASKHPDAIQSIVVQNGNAYKEGIGGAFDPMKPFWANRNSETERPVRNLLTKEMTVFQYTHGVSDPARVSPDSYTLDQFFLDRPGNAAIQLELLDDYRSNVALYDRWHEYFRSRQPRMLILWGKNDPFFTIEGAKAYQRDIPNAELHLIDTGHFALEDFSSFIAERMRTFRVQSAVPSGTTTLQRLEPAEGRRDVSIAGNMTVVVVHGAWADGSSWKYVILGLEREGLRVVAAPIPLTSFADDIAALKRAIARTEGPVILTGHAYAGAVIATVNDHRIKALVYIAGLAPDEGETVAKVFYQDEKHPQSPQLAPDADSFIWITAVSIRRRTN